MTDIKKLHKFFQEFGEVVVSDFTIAQGLDNSLVVLDPSGHVIEVFYQDDTEENPAMEAFSRAVAYCKGSWDSAKEDGYLFYTRESYSHSASE